MSKKVVPLYIIKNKTFNNKNQIDMKKNLQFNCVIEGVILNNNELTKSEINELQKDGYLVLSTDEEIEYEDDETGELLTGKITITHDDFFLFDVYENGEIVYEAEIPIESYLYQLDMYGALFAYPRVNFE